MNGIGRALIRRGKAPIRRGRAEKNFATPGQSEAGERTAKAKPRKAAHS